MVSGVEFEEDSFSPSRPRSQGGMSPANFVNSNERGLSGWLIRRGLAKSPAAAQTILVVVIIVDIIITYIVIKYFL